MPVRVLLIALGGLAVGALLGTVGAFWIPLRLAGVRVPLSPLLVPLAVVAACRVAGVRSGSRVASMAPALGWAAAVLTLASRGPGGDVVIVGGDPVATAYLLLGMAGAAAGAVLGLPSPGRPAPPPARRGTRPTTGAPASGEDAGTATRH